MKKTPAVKITCILERSAIPRAVSVLSDIKAGFVTSQTSRNASLKSSRGFFGLNARTVLDERGCETMRVWVPARAEIEVMEEIVSRARLATAGQGSIFSESVQLYAESDPDFSLDASSFAQNPSAPEQGAGKGASALHDQLIGIISVVQRDKGNVLARSILEAGFSVPNLSYGQGMGLRSKLGLLRVTIPADKETVFLMVHKYDAQEALTLVSENIGLDVSGRGFIYAFPIRKGLADTRIHLETGRYHVASMEQVIMAIDQLSGNSFWRRRSALQTPEREGRRLRRVVPKFASPKRERELVNLTLSCADGLAADYLEMAMILGAKGATLTQTQGLSFRGDPDGSREARESSDLILEADKAENIIEAIGAMGFFGPKIGGIAEVSAVNESIANDPNNK